MIKCKRILSLVMALAMVFSLLPLQVFAADETSAVASTEVTITLHEVDGVTKVEAVYSEPVVFDDTYFYIGEAGASGQFVLRNVSSDEIWSFACNHAGLTVFTADGVAVTSGGEVSVNPGDEVTISFTMEKASGYIEFADFTSQTATASGIQFLYEDTLGSVTVAGADVANGDYVDVPAAGATLTATVTKSDASFLGWVDENGKLLSSSTTYTLVPSGQTSVSAAFASASTEAWFYNSSKTYLYEGLDTALAGVASGTIVLAADGTLPAGDYTIPSGITLLIPFDDAHTLYTTVPGHAGSTWTRPTAFRTLTMASGANIAVASGGAISVSGKHSAQMKRNGAPTGPQGFLAMNDGSSITVNSGAKLYAWGFVTGSGAITVKSGATVYECFQVSDWRGGTVSEELYDNRSQYKVFPFSQYYVQNIEVPMTLEAGATENCYLTITAGGSQYSDEMVLIGGNGLIQMTSGSLTKDYDENTDRLILTANGVVTLSSINISVNLGGWVGTIDIDSAEFVFPLNNNITVNVNAGSTFNVTQDVALLPGTVLNIAETAVCNVTSGKCLYVYDGDDWADGYCHIDDRFRAVPHAPGQKYTRTNNDLVDAEILVNGTVNASSAHIYTTTGGAKIYSTGTGVINSNEATANDFVYQGDQEDTTWTPIAIAVTPAKLLNGNGKYARTVGRGGTFTYTDAAWVNGEHMSIETVKTAAGCLTQGVMEISCSCGECETYTEVIPAKGHNYEKNETTLHTCTTDGYAIYTCSGCGATYEAVVPASHEFTEWTPVDGDEDARIRHCSVCGHTDELRRLTLPTEYSGLVYAEENPTGFYAGTHNIAAVLGIAESDTYTYTENGKTISVSIDGTNVAISGETDGLLYFDLQKGEFSEGSITYEPTVAYSLPAGNYRFGYVSVGEGTTRPNFMIRNVACTGQTLATTTNQPVQYFENVTTDAFGVPYLYFPSAKEYNYAGNLVLVMGENVSSYDAENSQVEKYTGVGDFNVDGYVWSADSDVVLYGIHTHEYEAVVTPPTCDGRGYTTYTCSCGDSYVDDYVDAAHNFGDWTAAAEDVRTRTCVTCGELERVYRLELPTSYTGDVYVEENSRGLYVTDNPNMMAVLGIKDGEYTQDDLTITIDGAKISIQGSTSAAVYFDLQKGTFGTPDYTRDVGYGLPSAEYRMGLAGEGSTAFQFIIRNANNSPSGNLINTSLNTGFKTQSLDGDKFGVPYLYVGAGDKEHSFEGYLVLTIGGSADYDETTSQIKKTIEEDGVFDVDGYLVPGSDDTGVFAYNIDHSYNAVVTAPTCDGRGYTTYICTHCDYSYVSDWVYEAHEYGNWEAPSEDVRTRTCALCGYVDSYTRITLPTDYSGAVYAEQSSSLIYAGTRNVAEVLGIVESGTYTSGDLTITVDGTKITATGTVAATTYFDLQSGEFSNSRFSLTDLGYKLPDGDYTFGLYGEGENNTIRFGIRNVGDNADANNNKNAMLTLKATRIVTYSDFDADVLGVPYLLFDAGEVDFKGHLVLTIGADETYVSQVSRVEKIEGTGLFDVDGYLWTVGDSPDIFAHHEHSYEGIVTEPTCTEQGYTTYTCPCGDSYVDDYVDFGHDYQGAVTEPTCTERGYTTYTCSGCGDSYVDDYVEAGHSYGEWTASGEDERTGTCGSCGETVTLSRLTLPTDYSGMIYVEQSASLIYAGTRNVAEVLGIVESGTYTSGGLTITVDGTKITATGTVASNNTYFNLQTGEFSNAKFGDDPGYKLPDGDYTFGLYGEGENNTIRFGIRNVGNSPDANNNKNAMLTLKAMRIVTYSDFDADVLGVPYLLFDAGEVDFKGHLVLTMGTNSMHNAQVSQVDKIETSGVYDVDGYMWTVDESVAVFGYVENQEAKSTSVVYVPGAEEYIQVYLPQEEGYLEIQMNLQNSVSTNNGYGWRINRMWACDDSYNRKFPVTNAGEFEMAIKLNGRPDFIGMGAHGSERMTSCAFYVDGVEVTLDQLAALTEWETLRMIRYSDMYDPNDEVTKVGVHYVEYLYDANGLTVNQTVDWATADNCETSYMMMFPVHRTYDNLQVTDTYYDNYDSNKYDVSQAGFTGYPYTWTSGATKMTVYSEKSGVTASLENVSSTDIPGMGYKQCSNSNSYNKLYFTICRKDAGLQAVNPGDQWATTTRYEVTIEEGTQVDCISGHTYDEGVVIPPTCTEPGYTTYTCELCGDSYVDAETEALGHSYGDPEYFWNTVIDPVTCTATFTCTVCAEGTTGRVEIKDCSVEETSRVEATCGADGSVVYTATVELGDETYTDESDEVVIPATGKHSLTATEAKDATCTAPGNSAYWTCGTCGKYFSDAEGKEEIEKDSWILDQLDHSYTGDWVITDEGHARKCVNGCDGTDTVVPHTDDDSNNVCDDCQYAIPATGGGEAEPFVPTIGNGTTAGTAGENGSVTVTYGATEITVAAPASGWVVGENTFTVASTNDIACVVLVKNADGGYDRIPASMVDGKHSFTATLAVGDQIVVAVFGDLNEDGVVDTIDAGQMQRIAVKSRTCTELNVLTCDINGDGVVDTIDAGQAQRVAVKSRTLQW